MNSVSVKNGEKFSKLHVVVVQLNKIMLWECWDLYTVIIKHMFCWMQKQPLLETIISN